MINTQNQAKYQKLKEYLKEEILLGRIKPGEKIPSENMLAGRFSLSRHTVRKAISMLVYEGYLYTEHGRGTFCCGRSGRGGNSKNIGVITTYISEYIFPGVIQGIDNVLSGKGYSIVLKNTNNDTEKEMICLEDILSKNIEGLIVEPTKSALFSGNLKYYEALDRLNIPYVFIHGYYERLGDKPQVALDDAAGMYSVVDYLAKLGHKHIAGIFKADDIQGLNRHKGYTRALADNGIPYDPDYVIWFHTEDKNIKPFDVIRGMLEKKNKLDAIACYNDEIAYKVFQLLQEIGVNVPEDISITGFDDSFLSINCPVKLTSVVHPKEKLGEIAAALLLDIIEGNKGGRNPVKHVIVPELVIRDSCKKRLRHG